MTKIEHIITFLERIAPSSYQETYDNSGLIIGNPLQSVTGILICIDVTNEVIDEAKARECNLIITHHPIIFQPLHRLTGATYTEKCIIKIIKNDIAIYAMHTNLDNVGHGVSYNLAHSLGLQDIKLLLPKKQMSYKLTTFVPHQSASYIHTLLQQLVARSTMDYPVTTNFTSKGKSSYKTYMDNGIPQLHDQKKTLEEEKIEVAFPKHLEQNIIKVLQDAHPYKNSPYYIQQLESTMDEVGSGAIGTLNLPLASRYFLKYIKTKLGIPEIAHTAYIEKSIVKVAVCGGAGSFLIKEAIKQEADAFVTGDLKYHDFFEAEGKILLADIGHYNSEVGTKDLIYMLLSKKFNNIVVIRCKTVTNPVYHI